MNPCNLPSLYFTTRSSNATSDDRFPSATLKRARSNCLASPRILCARAFARERSARAAAMRANADVIVRASAIELVPYRVEHVERYHEWMGDESILVSTASERLTLEQELEMQREWANDEAKCTFIVRDAKTSTMIGDVNFFFNDHDDARACEIEIMIAEPSYRRKGYATEALETFMAYGAMELGVTTFVAKIGFENEPSLGLFARLGYVERSRSEIFQEVTLELRARDSNGDALSRFSDVWSRVERGSYDAHEARRLADGS